MEIGSWMGMGSGNRGLETAPTLGRGTGRREERVFMGLLDEVLRKRSALFPEVYSNIGGTDTAFSPEMPSFFSSGRDTGRVIEDDEMEKKRNQLEKLQGKVQEYGYNPPPKKKKSLLDYLINGLSVLQYPVANIGENLLGVSENSGKGLAGLWEDTAAGFKAGLSRDDGKPGDWQDILRKKIGLADTGNYYADVGLNFARELAGVAGNIILDPMNLLLPGVGKLAQRGGKLLKASKLAKTGLTMLDDAGLKAAAGMLTREYGDTLLKQGLSKTDDLFKGTMKSYYDDTLKILTKDKGGIKLNLPSLVDVPGGKQAGGLSAFLPEGKDLHIPFFRESDHYVGKTLIDTDKYFRKAGIPQALDAMKAKLTGADTDFVNVRIHQKIADQVKNDPDGLLSRAFLKPVDNAKMYDPAKAMDEIRGQVNPQEVIDTAFARYHKYGIAQDPYQVKQLQTAYSEVIRNNPIVAKLGSQIEDTVSTKSARAAHSFIDELTKGVSEAITGQPYGKVDIDYAKEVKANLLSFTEDPLIAKARNSWVRFGGDPPLGLEKTFMGRFVDMANRALVKEYHLPVDMAKLLRQYHLTGYGDKMDIDNVVGESRQFFKSEDEMKKVYLHIMKPAKYQIDDSWTKEMKDGVDWLRQTLDPVSGHKTLVYEAEHGLFEPRKTYIPQVFQKGPKDPKDIVGVGSLTDSAESWRSDMQSFLRFMEDAVFENAPHSAPSVKKIINRFITMDKMGRIDIPDKHTFSRMLEDIDEAVLQGRDPLMDIPQLMKIRLEASYRLTRQHELLEAFKKAKGIAVEIPAGKLMQYEQFIGGPPPGYVMGKNLNIPQLNNYLVDENAAKYLVKHFVPQKKNELLDMYDKVLKEWKWLTTIPNPSFHSRNALGNVVTNWFANVQDPGLYYTAGKLQKADPEKLLGMKIKLPHGEMSGADFVNLAKEKGVLSGFLEKEVIGSDLFSKMGKGWQKFKKGIEKVSQGEFIEHNARLAHFMDKMQKGWSPDAAADSVKKFLFDYSEIAPGDEVMKRIVPFWTWMRNNIPLQLENLVRHPGKFGIMGKMKHAFEGGAERSKWLAENEERPDWLKESLHFRLPDNFSINGKPTIAKLGLPMEDLARMGDFKEWWSSVTPPLKLIPEYIFNKHSFFGSDIIDKDLLHDKELHTVKTDPLVAAPLSHIPGVRDVLQIRKGRDRFSGGDQYEMNAWAHHLYSSALRPVKEVSKFADPETAFITRLMNFAGPAKVYQYDPRRQEFYNIMEEIKRFRAILKKLDGEQVRDGIGRGTGR